MAEQTIYRCTKPCRINKKCFIIKLLEPLKNPIKVLLKCKDTHQDILVSIGETKEWLKEKL